MSMANDQYLTKAMMDNLILVHGASASTPRPSTAVQNSIPPPRVTKSDILGQWEQDRFETDRGSSLNAGATGEQRQESSTASSWQAFAQSNTSMPLPPLRGRDAGADRVSRRENLVAGDGMRHGPGYWRSPTLPTLPTLSTAPPQGQVHTSPISHSCGPRPTVVKSIPQDQALPKRRSEIYHSHCEGTPVSAPQAKRASPDRSSSLSAAFSGDVASTGIGTLGGIFQHSRKPGFERWASPRTRPHMVAPNGTTIIPSTLQTKHSIPRHLPSTIISPEATAQTGSNRTQESQPSKSSFTNTPPSSQLQLSFPPQTTQTKPPSTPIPTGIPTTTIPAKFRAKTTDDIARRLIFAGIGAGRVPERTEEELKKRQEEQERRRLQREEREKLGKEQVMKWCGLDVMKPEMKTTGQAGSRRM